MTSYSVFVFMCVWAWDQLLDWIYELRFHACMISIKSYCNNCCILALKPTVLTPKLIWSTITLSVVRCSSDEVFLSRIHLRIEKTLTLFLFTVYTFSVHVLSSWFIIFCSQFSVYVSPSRHLSPSPIYHLPTGTAINEQRSNYTRRRDRACIRQPARPVLRISSFPANRRLVQIDKIQLRKKY